MSLRVCSLAARGLWIEMLSIMGISERYGYLQIGGQLVTDAQLAVMAGCSEEQAKVLIAELESHNVFSRDENGIPFSRRMVRELIDYQKGAETGKMGGNPVLTQKQEARSNQARSQKLEQPLTGGLKGGLNPQSADNQQPVLDLTIDDTPVKREAEAKESADFEAAKNRIGQWFGRRPSTKWSPKELKALHELGCPPPSMNDLEAYYTARIPKAEDYRRRDIQTLLNNWTGEIDRAFRWQKSKPLVNCI